MQARLEALTMDKGEPGASSGDAFNKPPRPRAAAAKTKPAPVGPGNPEPSDAAKQAKLRRVCERKPSGKLKVSEAIHLKWKNGSRAERDEMLEVLEEAEWDKDHGYIIHIDSIYVDMVVSVISHDKYGDGIGWVSPGCFSV